MNIRVMNYICESRNTFIWQAMLKEGMISVTNYLRPNTARPRGDETRNDNRNRNWSRALN